MVSLDLDKVAGVMNTEVPFLIKSNYEMTIEGIRSIYVQFQSCRTHSIVPYEVVREDVSLHYGLDLNDYRCGGINVISSEQCFILTE